MWKTYVKIVAEVRAAIDKELATSEYEKRSIDFLCEQFKLAVDNFKIHN